jgi:hypothetical protein
MNAVRDVTGVQSLVAGWYARNHDILRLWVYEAADAVVHEVNVVVALMPVCDSDEIHPVWLAKCKDWQRELQGLLGTAVHLDWYDVESELAPCGTVKGWSRNCLVNVAWRDFSGGTITDERSR